MNPLRTDDSASSVRDRTDMSQLSVAERVEMFGEAS
jgi:hypothetical protein